MTRIFGPSPQGILAQGFTTSANGRSWLYPDLIIAPGRRPFQHINFQTEILPRRSRRNTPLFPSRSATPIVYRAAKVRAVIFKTLNPRFCRFLALILKRNSEQTQRVMSNGHTESILEDFRSRPCAFVRCAESALSACLRAMGGRANRRRAPLSNRRHLAIRVPPSDAA